MEAVSYLRVSTKKQGISGLGLEAQKEAIGRLLADKGGKLIAEFIEVESGSKNDRTELAKAINYAKKTGTLLVIAKLDRISRRVSFVASLMESGVKFAIAELPGATEFQIHIYAALAQEERRLISERTKVALAAVKKRGTPLGCNGKILAAKNKLNAIKFAQNFKETLLDLRGLGMSFKEIANEFNNKGISSYKGRQWYATTVQRCYMRINDSAL